MTTSDGGAAPRRVLIVNLTRFGDWLQTSPTVFSLGTGPSAAEVTLLSDRNFAEVCAGIPGAARVIEADLDRVARHLLEGGKRLADAYAYFRDLVGELRAARFDLALNFSSSRMSGILMSLLRAREVRGWSMSPDGFRLINHPWSRVFAASCLHRTVAPFNLVDVYLRIAGAWGGPQRLLYQVPAEAHAWAEEFLAGERRPLIALQLGASREVRQWPRRAWACLARRLREDIGATVLLIGGPGDRELAELVVAEVPVVNACGQTNVPRLGALLARAGALVTCDTGPMHMAAAVGTPVIGLFFGPASPFDTGTYGGDHLLLWSHPPCAPCSHRVTCVQPFCRERLAPEDVARAVVLRLAEDWVGLERWARTLPREVEVRRTAFDADGFHDCPRLAGGAETRQERVRRCYRELWKSLLRPEGSRPAGVPQSAPPTTGPFTDLVGLAERGHGLAARLEREARSGASIAEIERLGAAIEKVDSQVARVGVVAAEAALLTCVTRFERENLAADEVAAVAAGTARLYAALGERARRMALALDPRLSDDGKETGCRERLWA